MQGLFLRLNYLENPREMGDFVAHFERYPLVVVLVVLNGEAIVQEKSTVGVSPIPEVYLTVGLKPVK